MTVEPASVWVQGNTAGVRGLFSNASVTVAYNIETVGVYATDGTTEVLFSVSTATTPDEMPAYNGVAPSSFIFTVQETISEAASISINVTTTGTATAADIADLQASKQDVITGAASTIVSSNLTGERALVTNANGKVTISSATAQDLGRLHGVTSDVQTQIDGKQDIITGAASSIVERDLVPGRVLISSASGKVYTDTNTVTSTELSYLSGCIGNVQAQLSGKQATITGAASTVTGSDLTASRALASSGSGKIAATSVTTAELGRLSGVTAPIQTQIDGKQATITGAATTITDSNLTPSRALASSETAGKVVVSNATLTELNRLSGVTSNVQTQLDAKQATITGAASTITDSNLTPSRALASSETAGKVVVANTTLAELNRLSGVTSNVQGQLDTLSAGLAGKAAYLATGNSAVNATISSGNTQNLLPSAAVDNTYFSVTTGGVFTFKTAGTYLMLTRFQMGSPTSGGVARLDLEARYRAAGSTSWGTKENIGSDWVTGAFGTVMGMNIITAPSAGYQMFLDTLAVDGAAKLNAFFVYLFKL